MGGAVGAARLRGAAGGCQVVGLPPVLVSRFGTSREVPTCQAAANRSCHGPAHY